MQTETKEEKPAEVKKYINTHWIPGYFETMRKVMG